MVFKRVLAAFGVGGPSVDTVLDVPHATPGQVITGRVRIEGGSTDADIERIELSLVTRAEAEYGDGEAQGAAEFLRVTVSDHLRIPAGQRHDVPFRLALPWETPVTAVGATPLPGMTVGVRTELVIAGALDKGDLDPVTVRPLPSQDAVLDAFGELGFQFRGADVEIGRLHRVPQQLGVYQEIEFFPPPQAAGRLNEVELTFVANPHELHVVLEADRRGGLLSSGADSFGRFAMTHPDAERADWTGLIRGWLTETIERRPAFGVTHSPGTKAGHGHHDRRGPGMGAIIGGAAAGALAGMILGDLVDDVFDGGEADFGADG